MAGVTLGSANRGTQSSSEGALVEVRIGDEVVELPWDLWEARVRSGQIGATTEVRIEAITGDRFVVAGDLESFRSLRGHDAEDHRLAGPPPWMTALMVGVQIRIWWFTKIDAVYANTDRFTNWGPPILEDGQVWRLFTSGLLHTDLIHVSMNLLWLAYAGWNLERTLGRINLALLFTASVLGGSLLSMMLTPETSSLGSSGGVYGLVAATVAFGFARPELLPRKGRVVFGIALLPYLVLMFFSGLSNDRVDNWAHFGGLIVGGGLALVLFPPNRQPRPGWNRRIHVMVGAISAVCVAICLLAGPRITPLIHNLDHQDRLAEMRGRSPAPRDLDRYRPLSYDVPGGWRPGVDAVRRTAVTSPVGDGSLRAWGVHVRSHDTHQDLDVRAADWADAVREAWPEAQVGPAEATTLAGYPGLRIEARIEREASPLWLEWRGVVRGAWTLDAVWQVDEGRRRWLAPLHRRLLDAVVWGDPSELHDARLEHARVPRGRKPRVALALALARIGDVDEALVLHEALVLEDGTDPDRWVDALEIVRVGGVPMEVQRSWWSRALAAAPSPTVVDEVARGLVAADASDLAAGLVDLAWRRAPADRVLRKARRRLGLPVALDPETGSPWGIVHDPLTGLRHDDRHGPEVDEVPALTLAAARGAADALQEERRAVVAAAVAAIAADDPAGFVPLLVLRMGHAPIDDPDARLALRDQLSRGASGSPPPWMPPEIAAALAANPDYGAPLGTP